MEHTQGEWKTQINGFGDFGIMSAYNPIYPIAKLERKFRPIEEIEANAKLIASAPELLEACKYVLECLEASQNARNFGGPVLRKAIKKATE